LLVLVVSRARASNRNVLQRQTPRRRRLTFTLRGELVFVDQAAEPVAATEPVERENVALGSFAERWRLGERWVLAQRAVRPMLVVGR
jgi:hypothetical protein